MLNFVLKIFIEAYFIFGEFYFVVESDIIELLGPGVVIVQMKGLI
jgi:hypothetical protein